MLIKRFENITQYDLTSYFEKMSKFFKNDYYSIVAYYSGDIEKLDNDIIAKYDELITEAHKIDAIVNNFAYLLDNIDFWELVDTLSDFYIKLQTISKLPKYLRSSRTDFNFKSGYAHSYNLSNESLEQVSKNIKQDTDWDNDWTKIALNNKLLEIDYTVNNNPNITIYQEKFVKDFVTSVFDIMVGERIYGRDIDKSFLFENDDIKVLNYKETVFQTVNILSSLLKGHIPEYPELGIPSGLYTGSNIGSFIYASISLDMQKIFLTDDLFVNFTIKQINHEEDKIFIKFEVETKLKMLIEAQSIL